MNALTAMRMARTAVNDLFLKEKANRDIDDLTPLDARDSLLMDHPQRKELGWDAYHKVALTYQLLFSP
jgi:hypothetical protein